MNPILGIDVESPTPVYEQIRAQIAASVRTGVLGEGDRLPTVRALAADLGIAVNTVVRAYQELQAEGLVRIAGRHGTVIAFPRHVPDLTVLRHIAGTLAARASEMDVDDDTVLALVSEALRQSASHSLPNAKEVPTVSVGTSC